MLKVMPSAVRTVFRPRPILWVLAVGVGAWLGATTALFVRPEADRARPADAVVVLGPGRGGERLAEGLELMRRHVSDAVVVSMSRRRRWPLEDELCRARNAVCFRADPFTPRGEAREVARIARAHGWSHLLLVTSTYHVTRARLLNERCFDGTIDVAAADTPWGIRSAVWAIAHEWGGLVNALVLARGC
jgi:uncharacterized SAM-binding protein YcdF (DUF218 family)